MLLKYQFLKLLWYCVFKAGLFPPKSRLQEAKAVFQTLPLAGKHFHQQRILNNELSVCTTPVRMFSCCFCILPFARHIMGHNLRLSCSLERPALGTLWNWVKWSCRSSGPQIMALSVLVAQRGPCALHPGLLALLLEPNAFRSHQMKSKTII